MSCILPDLSPCTVRGVNWWLDKKRCRYRIQFRRRGRTKSITHASTHPQRVYREFLAMADDFNRGTFDPWAEQKTELTLEEAVRRYTQLVRREKSAKYADQVQDVLSAFARTVGTGRAAAAVTADELREYYAARHRSRATQRTYFGVLRIFFTWCRRQGYIETNPLEEIRPPRKVKRPPAYFMPSDFQLLIRTIEAAIALKRSRIAGAGRRLSGAAARSFLDDLPDICRLAVESGLRRGELLHLRWTDVDQARRRIYVRSYRDKRRGFAFEPKSRSDRVVPMSPGAAQIFSRRAESRINEDDTALVFPGRSGKPRDGHNLSETFRRYRREAGLPENLHFHSLRHTCASWLASSGVPLLIIKEMMGHADLRTTMQYAHLLPDASQWPGSRYHDELMHACNMRAENEKH